MIQRFVMGVLVGVWAAGACAANAPALPTAPAAPVGTAPASAAPAGSTDDIQVAGDLTVITSDKLTYDATKGFAEFLNNVIVSDPNMKMKTDKLTLYFQGKSEVTKIVAEGGVVMSQADRRAWAQKATYDVATGQITLEGSPRVMRGKDMLMGDRIIFWRDENRMLVESGSRAPTMQNPGARLVIYPEKGRSPLLPPGDKKSGSGKKNTGSN